MVPSQVIVPLFLLIWLGGAVAFGTLGRFVGANTNIGTRYCLGFASGWLLFGWPLAMLLAVSLVSVAD